MKILCAFFLAVIALTLGLPRADARRKPSKPEANAEESKTDPDTSNYKKAGLDAAKAGNWDKAIENFKRAAETDPNNRDVNHNLGLAYRQRALDEIKKQNWAGAISDFTESLKRKENDPVARRFRAFAEMQMKDYDKAITDYSAVIKQQPKDVDSYLGRSYAYEVTGNVDQGLADVEVVLKIQPTNSDAANRKKRLIAQKNQGQPSTPAPVATPVLFGTPIPRVEPSPVAKKPSSSPSATPSATASPQ
ncbi:MAG: tetratricopeptide repeat protein [Verrucomicrobiota bacterium]|nr:tetratricopeptide repeat protein [Verrucomicrobiota bacterium]